MIVYPYQIFDPAWLNEKNEATDEFFDQFFQKNASPDEFYPGAIAYHWHNRWGLEIDEDSRFAKLERRYWAILKEKLIL